MYRKCIEIYDDLIWKAPKLAPVCASEATAELFIDISMDGKINSVEMEKKRVILLQTSESVSRTSGVAPRPLHDKMTYLSKSASPKHHEKYMELLASWKHLDGRVAAVYNLLQDIDILGYVADALDVDAGKIALNTVYFTFDGEDATEDLYHKWENYYLGTLENNGFDMIDGKDAYIPSSYRASIIRPGDYGRLFSSKTDDGRFQRSANRFGVSFVSAQKVCNVLAYLCSTNYVDLGKDKITWYADRSDELDEDGKKKMQSVTVFILSKPTDGELAVTFCQTFDDADGALRAIYFIKDYARKDTAKRVFIEMLSLIK